jgi:hypothetical protein
MDVDGVEEILDFGEGLEALAAEGAVLFVGGVGRGAAAGAAEMI